MDAEMKAVRERAGGGPSWRRTGVESGGFRARGSAASVSSCLRLRAQFDKSPRRPAPDRSSRRATRARPVHLHLRVADAEGPVADHAAVFHALVASPTPSMPSGGTALRSIATLNVGGDRAAFGNSTTPAAPAANTSVRPSRAAQFRVVAVPTGSMRAPGTRRNLLADRRGPRLLARADTNLGAFAGQQASDALPDGPGAAQDESLCDP